MSHLFALQGRENCGKSATLICLFGAISSKYPSATVQVLKNGTVDIKVIISGVNGLVVGIESQGDPNSRLMQSLNDFLRAKCDIIFCACRTRGMTVSWVNALSTTYKINFVAQSVVANNYGGANKATASSLMKKAGI